MKGAIEAGKEVGKEVLEAGKELFDKAKDMTEEQMAKVFHPVLQGAVQEIIDWMPKGIGHNISSKMAGLYESLSVTFDLREQVEAHLKKTLPDMTQELRDFVESVDEEPIDGFSKVGTAALRLNRRVMMESIAHCESLVPSGCCGGNKASADTAFVQTLGAKEGNQEITDMFKKAFNKAGVPNIIMDQVNFDFKEDDEIGQPRKKAPPYSQTMK